MYTKGCRCIQVTHNGKTPANRRIGGLRQKMTPVIILFVGTKMCWNIAGDVPPAGRLEVARSWDLKIKCAGTVVSPEFTDLGIGKRYSKEYPRKWFLGVVQQSGIFLLEQTATV